MDTIDRIAKEEGLTGSFIHTHALALFEYCKLGPESAMLCYWLISNLEPDYIGGCAYELIPYDITLTKEENLQLQKETERRIMNQVMDILMLCGGNLLHPSYSPSLERIDNLKLKEHIGGGAYGEVYLANGYAVKITLYDSIAEYVIALLRETTALAILGRLHFIGLSRDTYYIGMDYYPEPLSFDTPELTKAQLLEELAQIHEKGIIHCDISLNNTRTDAKGRAKIIDFGECRFTPAINADTFIGTDSYRDYLLLKSAKADFGSEIDIWSLGIIFYILETRSCPWMESNNNFVKAIEEQWESSMTKASPLVQSMLSLTKEDRYTL